MKKLLASMVAVGVLMVGCGGDTGAAKKDEKKNTPAKTETKPDASKKEEKK